MVDTVAPAVAGLCRELASRPALAGTTLAGTELAGVEAGLGEPLRIAIGGRVSSGKSTLVNALLRGRYAPIRAQETAQVTTVYRRGAPGRPMRCRLIRADGVLEVPPTADGTVPVVAPDGDAYLEVLLDAPLLSELELIDTPGLYSADTTGYSDAGRMALSAETARRTAEADAVLFLVGTATSRVEARTVDDLQRMLPADRSGLTVVAVLSRVDQLHDTVLDPFEAGAKVADAVRRGLGAAVGDVVGVSGLLACAALPGGLDDGDLALLRELRWAGFQGPVDGTFEEYGPAGTEQQRGRLLGRLERFGVGWAVQRAGLHRAQLFDALWERSGIADVERVVRVRFQRHASLLKAERALTRLERLARTAEPADAVAIRVGVAALRRMPDLHRLAEDRALRALRRLGDGTLGLPRAIRDDLIVLFLGDTPGARLGVPPTAPPEQVRDRIVRLQRALLATGHHLAALSGEEVEIVQTAMLTLAQLIRECEESP